MQKNDRAYAAANTMRLIEWDHFFEAVINSVYDVSDLGNGPVFMLRDQPLVVFEVFYQR